MEGFASPLRTAIVLSDPKRLMGLSFYLVGTFPSARLINRHRQQFTMSISDSARPGCGNGSGFGIGILLAGLWAIISVPSREETGQARPSPTSTALRSMDSYRDRATTLMDQTAVGRLQHCDGIQQRHRLRWSVKYKGMHRQYKGMADMFQGNRTLWLIHPPTFTP